MDEEVRMTIGQALDLIASETRVERHEFSQTNYVVFLPNGYEVSLYFGHVDGPMNPHTYTFVEAAVFAPGRMWLVPDHEIDYEGNRALSHVMPYTNAHELIRLVDRVAMLPDAPEGRCWCVECETTKRKEAEGCDVQRVA